MKKVILYANPERDIGYRTSREVALRLGTLGIECVCLESSPIPGIKKELDDLAFIEAITVISLGGDGTLLRCAKLTLDYNVPVIGVNLGHTGFLTQLNPDNLDELAKLADGRYSVAYRMLLKAEIKSGNAVKLTKTALNDIVVSRGPSAQSVSLDLRVHGQLLGSFIGDGVIASTATGSTGYALSAGGPVIDPDVDALLVTPICAHTSYAHSFVLAAEKLIEISSPHAHRPVYVSVDGDEPVCLAPGEKVFIAKSDKHIPILLLEGYTFFQNVRTKIHRL